MVTTNMNSSPWHIQCYPWSCPATLQGHLGVHMKEASAALHTARTTAQAQLPTAQARVAAALQQLCAQPGAASARELEVVHALVVQTCQLSQVALV